MNATTVSQSIIGTLNKFEVGFNNVSAVVTDNASYMLKTEGIWKDLLPNVVHITCNAHILSLVGRSLALKLFLYTAFRVR